MAYRKPTELGGRYYERNKRSLHERINDPEIPSTLKDVAEDLAREEKEKKTAKNRARFVVPFVKEPCEVSPTGAHWWIYPPQGVRRETFCRYCGGGA